MVSGKQYDIYSSEKRLSSALTSFTASSILDSNKELIVKFIHSIKAQGISERRMLKNSYMLHKLASKKKTLSYLTDLTTTTTYTKRNNMNSKPLTSNNKPFIKSRRQESYLFYTTI